MLRFYTNRKRINPGAVTRAALWTGLGEAVEAVQAAVDEYERAPTPQRRAVRDAAFREYVRRLPHVIGNAEANRYEASWVAYQEATERVEQLAVRLGLLPSTDATDRQLQQQLIDAQAAAGKAFGVATVALEAALDRARAHDEKGGA